MTRRAKLQAILDAAQAQGVDIAADLRAFTANGGSGIENYLNEAFERFSSTVVDNSARIRELVAELASLV